MTWQKKMTILVGTNTALDNLPSKEERMNLQKTILGQYILLKSGPTLKEISIDTGIQITRVFRLFNGALMSLSEYQIFQQKIKEDMGLTNSLESIAFDCSLKLNSDAIKEIEVYLSRKLQMWKLKQIILNSNYNKIELTA